LVGATQLEEANKILKSRENPESKRRARERFWFLLLNDVVVIESALLRIDSQTFLARNKTLVADKKFLAIITEGIFQQVPRSREESLCTLPLL